MARSTAEINKQLFHPGRGYLIGSFTKAREKRRPLLEESARWLELDPLLTAADVPMSKDASVEDRWLALLRSVVPALEPADGEMLAKLTDVLETMADSDVDIPIEQVWQDLRIRLGGDKAKGTAITTLRGHRWINLRWKVAQQLESLAGVPTRPRADLPRRPVDLDLFTDDALAAIGEALDADRFDRLVVLAAPIRWGVSELALRFAWHQVDTVDPPRYSLIRWLRASDPLLLHHDVRRLTADLFPGSREAEAYRQTMAHLEQVQALLIFEDVREIADIAPYLADVARARVLVTSSTELPWREVLRAVPLAPHNGSTPGTERTEDVPSDVRELSDRLFGAPTNGRLAGQLGLQGAPRDLVDQFAELLSHPGAGPPLAPTRLGIVLTRVLLDEGADVAEVVHGLAAHRAQLESNGEAWQPAVGVATVLLERLVAEHGGRDRWRAQWLGDDGTTGEGDTKILQALRLLEVLRRFAQGPIPLWALDPAKPPRQDPDRNRLFPLVEVLVRLHLVELDDKAGTPRSIRISEEVALAADRALVQDDGAIDAVATATAAYRVLSIMAHIPVDERDDLYFETIVHGEQLASELERERPVAAAELWARTAALYHRVGWHRHSHAAVDRAVGALKRSEEGAVRATFRVADATAEWAGAITRGDPLPNPLLRMAQTLRALRWAEFTEGARRLYRTVAEFVPDEVVDDPELRHALARFWFASARVVYDPTQSDEARRLLERAHDVWQHLEGVRAERWRTAVLALRGLLQLGKGDPLPATQLEAPAAPPDPITSAEDRNLIGELARLHTVRGLGFHQLGNLPQALAEHEESVRLWACVPEDREDGDHVTMRNANALSNLAVVLAELGDDSAVDKASKAYDRAIHQFGESHRETNIARANLALVNRLLGDVDAAREVHEQAARAVLHDWGQTYPLALESKLEAALTLAATGDSLQALELLLPDPEKPNPMIADEARSAGDLLPARWLAIAGRIAVFATPPRCRSEKGQDNPALVAAKFALDFAAGSFRAVEELVGVRHPDALTCDTARAELLLRKEDPMAARTILEEAIEVYRRDQVRPLRVGIGNREREGLLRAQARLLRALAASPQDMDEAAWQELRHEVGRDLEPDDPRILACFELALADVAWQAHSKGGDPTTLLTTAAKSLDEVVDRTDIGRGVHPLRARRNAELAMLAEKLGRLGEAESYRRERDRAPGQLTNAVKDDLKYWARVATRDFHRHEALLRQALAERATARAADDRAPG